MPVPRLYTGHVMHMRLIPKAHRFRYRVFSLFLDIDRLDETAKRLRLLRLNQFGVLSFHNRDHGPRDGAALRPWVDAELSRKGLPRAEQVMLLSFPRMFGYAFNPLAVYYCYDAAGRLYAVIYQVKNTFGDQIAYTHAVGAKEGGSLHQTQPKQMYVSPFIEMDQTYRFTMAAPDDRLRLRIRQAGEAGETLIATHNADASELTDRTLLRAILTHPLMTFRVMWLIHWQALRLVIKGVPFLGSKGMSASAKKTA